MKVSIQYRPLTIDSKVVLKFSAALALMVAASKVSFAIGPVPLSMQTFAVAFIGAWLGMRLGTSVILSYLAMGFAGLPVFATPLCGPAAFFGPTAGYLFAFIPAAALTGFLAEKGWTGKRFFDSFIGQYASNILVCFLGALWLSASVGVEKAIMVGFVPFVIGALLKAILGTALLYAMSLTKK